MRAALAFKSQSYLMIYSCEAEFHGIFERFFDDGFTMQIPQKPPIATYLYTVDRVWKLKSKKSKKIYSYALSYRDLEQIDPILNFPLPSEDLELVILHSVSGHLKIQNWLHLF